MAVSRSWRSLETNFSPLVMEGDEEDECEHQSVWYLFVKSLMQGRLMRPVACQNAYQQLRVRTLSCVPFDIAVERKGVGCCRAVMAGMVV